MDVLLTCMPYADAQHPSLALGLLQSALLKKNISTRSLYANLLFVLRWGTPPYSLTGNFTNMGAEWLFRRAAFPDFKVDDEGYFQLFAETLKRPLAGLKRELLRRRREAEIFLDELVPRILQLKPKIVGCTSSCLQQTPSLALLRRLKEKRPKIITLMGGANCETVMGQTIHQHFPWVDFVVSGEADELIVPLCKGILKHKTALPQNKIPLGVFAPLHRKIGYPGEAESRNEKTGEIQRDHFPRAVVLNLNTLPPPNYDDYFALLRKHKSHHQRLRPGLLAETARGCWWGEKKSCGFCGLNGLGRQFREKTPKNALRELDFLAKKYVPHVEYTDNILSEKYYKEFLPVLAKRKKKYNLFYECKSNQTEERIRLFKEAGISWIQPGIESLHTNVLALMNKGCAAWQNVLLLKWCRQYGIRAFWNILRNFPGEKDHWYREVARLLPAILHLQAPSSFQPIFLDRYSRYFNQAEKSHPGPGVLPATQYIFPLSGQAQKNLGYRFTQANNDLFHLSPELDTFFNPETKKVARLILAWNQLFHSPHCPTLLWRKTSVGIEIEDTRPSGGQLSHILYPLSGLEGELLFACDQAPLETLVQKEFLEQGIPLAALRKALKNLLLKRVLVRIDKRLLSVVLREPLPLMAEARNFPGGWIETQPDKDQTDYSKKRVGNLRWLLKSKPR